MNYADGTCCSEHGSNIVEFYCNTCGKNICLNCIEQDGKHQNCDYEKLSEISLKYERMIKLTLDKRISELSTCQGEITDQQVALLDVIHAKTAQLYAILDSRKSELIRQLCQLTQAKLSSLASQKEHIEVTRTKLNYMLDSLKLDQKDETLTVLICEMKEMTLKLEQQP